MEINPEELQSLILKARAVYEQNFSSEASFERAIFFSWGCSIGDCTFCYMSTQPQGKLLSETRRTTESILAEFFLAKQLGWDIGFFTGGIGVYSPEEIEQLLQKITLLIGEKIWLSVGPLSKPLLKRYFPYIKGVVGSTETINPDLHKIVCPSKPLAPYERMFEDAKDLGLLKAMTFIVGMGEKKEDFIILRAFIEKYDLNKIHVYGLIPQKGTVFAHTPIPTQEEQAWWIAHLRIAFPTLDIQCGVWEDRAERVGYLLGAGANSLSKFKALKLFGTKVANDMEQQIAHAGRIFRGTLTVIPEVDWEKELEKNPVEKELKQKIREKIFNEYLPKMQKNKEKMLLRV